MRFLGNILWFLFGGCILGLEWTLAGLFWCITVVGIPLGVQCFKFAALSFFPFGRQVVYGGGTVSTMANIVWLLLSGWLLAVTACAIGFVFFITIVGIPFGKQCFKIAKLALTPFGASVI